MSTAYEPLNQIPISIRARTPEQLSELMLINNFKRGKKFQYNSIQYVKGFWYAWYFEDVEKPKMKLVRDIQADSSAPNSKSMNKKKVK